MKELDLGTGNIGSLIKRYSIPCVISMVVAALYNIVDQIFIGWSIWKCCNKHSVSIYTTCNVKAVCKLGVLSTLGFFHGVP